VLGVDQWLDLRQEGLPVVPGLQRGAARLPIVEVGVAPHVGVGRERADVRGEGGDEAPEHLVLDRDALALIEVDELGQLAGVDVVVTLLDDHVAHYMTR
jgi:hypothetical protein